MLNAAILAALPIGVVVRTGASLACNEAAARLIGWPASRVDAVDVWFDVLYGDQAAAESARFEVYRQSGFVGTFTTRFRRRGAPCVVEIVARDLGDGREVWTLHDVTERALANERFRVLFERSTDAHLLFDQGGIIDCNPAAVAMLRCEDKRQLLATHPAAFSPEYQPDGQRSADKSVEMDAIARRQGFHRFDWVHRRMDGTDFPVEVTLNPVDLPAGPALLVVWHDLTERKETERALAEARDRALEGTRAKSVFLANMSHELRTPLNAIIGYSELLLEDAPSDDLEKVNHAGRHLLALINDILDLSKIEAGHLAMRTEWFDLSELATSVVEVVRPLATRNGNVVSVEVDPGVGAVCGDASRVRQVLLNLVGNACKFTHDGRLGIRAVRIDPVQLRIEVWDTGIGMDPVTRARIFDEFVQGDPSTTRKYGGTGLGLAITRRLCEAMGGSVSVESEVGCGSVFRVTLPVRPSAPAAARSAPVEVLRAHTEPGEPTVVVIDDDADARELVCRTVARAGFRAVCAADGLTGIELCRRHRPVAVLLDVLMPGLDGWQVLAALKADPELRALPVLLVSMVADEPRGFALGASHYLTKPIDRDALVATLSAYRPAKGPGTALVVEDDADLRSLLERTLGRAGWRVATAGHGADGLRRLEEAVPDLILLDLMMPVMDGFEFLATVRATPAWAHLPVVVVTARDLAPDESLYLRSRAQRVLGKAGVAADEWVLELEKVMAGTV